MKGSIKDVECLSKKCVFRYLWIGLCLWLFPILRLAGTSFNGFDLSTHAIPVKEIQRGGPPKDKIPAILHPKFVRADDATFLHAQDRILGVNKVGEAKAYPVAELGETAGSIVDKVNGAFMTIKNDPQSNSALIFDSQKTPIPSVVAYCFAWHAFHSDTLIFKAQ